MQRLVMAAKKVAGLKQTAKAVENGSAMLVYIAGDAEEKISIPIREQCRAKGIPLVETGTMNDLGKACGIQVGTATAAVLRHGDTPAEAGTVH